MWLLQQQSHVPNSVVQNKRKNHTTKMEYTDLYKTRSYSGCLRDAYRMVSTNFKTILRHTWMPISLSSAMGVISILFRLPDKDIHELGSNNPTITAIIVFLATIISMAAASWLLGEVYSLRLTTTEEKLTLSAVLPFRFFPLFWRYSIYSMPFLETTYSYFQ